MTLPVEINPAHLASTGYTVSRSVRLRSSASAYFNRTTTGSGSNTTSTISFWVKRGALTSAANQTLFSSERAAANDGFALYFDTADRLNLLTNQSAGATSFQLITTRVFRDPSAWYHVVLAIDTTQATASNRAILYINGVQETAFTTATYAAQNASIWLGTSGLVNYIGRVASSAIWWLYSYLAEYNVINGQQLTASSFGYTDNNGIWQPKAYTGTYGTNGFYLKFTDNSAATAAAIGKDYSGNGNNWTPNNISVTAGVTYDSMIDSPTVGAGASNYPVLNPIEIGATTKPTNGNLTYSPAGVSPEVAYSTFALPSTDKWYAEFTKGDTNVNWPAGIQGPTRSGITYAGQTQGIAYWAGGSIYKDGTAVQTSLPTLTTNDVLGIAVDMGASTVQFYKNGSAVGTAVSFTYTQIWFACGNYVSGLIFNANFGQRPFSYTPPAGFVALNTYNLPAATINNGGSYFNIAIATGANLSTAINSLAPAKDFRWVKNRTTAGTGHVLWDSIRGSTARLDSSATTAETTFDYSNLVQADNHVGWVWQAGQGVTSTSTAGSITSTVSVNQSAGFSIVSYTATGSNATVGHGLGVAPKMIIVKVRNGAVSNWHVYHASVGATAATFLNLTDAATTSINYWNNTAPTSSVFSVGIADGVNRSTGSIIAYCWSEVAGYSKFGSYVGNGAADGPFVYCGFRPRWILIKDITIGTTNWQILDTSRNTYNQVVNSLASNATIAESVYGSSYGIDVTANGFKIRLVGSPINTSADTHIFAAFAENPFKISRAR